MFVYSVQIASSAAESRAQRLQQAQVYLEQIHQSPQRPTQILFPELWPTGAFEFDSFATDAEPLQGETYEMMAAWARKLNCYIHTGSFVERDGPALYNTSLLLDPNGRLLTSYRKIHLFGYRSREQELVTPGSSIVVAPTEYGRVGLATCYDLRFPELFRAMVNLGAEYFLLPSGWPLARLNHWRLLGQARAVENQCFLFSCNAGGAPLAGHSMLIDPWGTVLAEAGEEGALLKAEVDLAAVGQIRAEFPALTDKRLV